MAKFCGKCGSRLDEATGLCPRCDAEQLRQLKEQKEQPRAEANQTHAAPHQPPDRKMAKKEKKAARKAEKKAARKARRAAWSTGKRVRRAALKGLLVILLLAVLSMAALGTLVYFELVSLPWAETALDWVGIKPRYGGQTINDCYVPSEKNIVYENDSKTLGYVNNIILLFAYSDVTEDRMAQIAEELDGKIVGTIPGLHQYQIRIEAADDREELEAICDQAMEYQEVKYATIDLVVGIENSDLYYPNDPWKDTFQGMFGVDWNENDPSGYNWWIEATKILSAWQYRNQFSSVRVGIVDNGFDTDHEDLNITVLNPDINNKEHHGTHVAGIIGARHNNQIGICGVMDNVELYGVDCYATKKQEKQNITVSSLLAGIQLCVDHHCKVINMSSGTKIMGLEDMKSASRKSARAAAIYLICMLDSLAEDDDFLVVQSAGNGNSSGTGIDAQTYNGFFASIDRELIQAVFKEFEEKKVQLEHEITEQDVLDSYLIVGAVDKKKKDNHWQLADFSNYGSAVTVCAPGVNVFSTTVMGGLNGNYANDSGTSMAAPIVAGVAAMVWSANPNLDSGEVKAILRDTADIPVSSRVKADNGSYRMINACAAVEKALEQKERAKSDAARGGEFDPSDLPDGAVEFNGHYYYLYDAASLAGTEVNTWENARDYCAGAGGYLATITSQEENDFLYSYITQQGCSDAFFGFTDEETEGYWGWVTGEAADYTNWHAGEPNNDGGSEDYGSFFYKNTDGTWNDGRFGNDTSAFLCEWGEYEIAPGNQPDPREDAEPAERDIVLTLDISGSMDGTPLQETKKASVKFVETALEEDAAVGIVTYDYMAYLVSDFSMNRTALENAISNIRSGGSTNIEDGLRQAQAMLSESRADKKIILLMSDGAPNDGLQGDDLIAYANAIKDTGVRIYTLGFFSSVGGSKSAEQLLMEQIASEGCHYEVANADDLVFFFQDMADQISGQKYIYVRIACPVDVSVTYQGQTLSSAEKEQNLRTDFGTLTFEDNEAAESGADDRVKVLRLKEGAEYDLHLEGTGRGLMDYTIGFMDDEGNYSDLRRFRRVKITRRTVIETVAAASEQSTLNIDEDGDGRVDLRLRADANGYGKEVKSYTLVYAAAGGALLLLVVCLVLVKKVRKRGKVR